MSDRAVRAGWLGLCLDLSGGSYGPILHPTDITHFFSNVREQVLVCHEIPSPQVRVHGDHSDHTDHSGDFLRITNESADNSS